MAHVGGKNGKTGVNVGAGSIPGDQGLDGERVSEIMSARIALSGSVDPSVLEPQRIGERVGDQRFRQSMSFAVRSRATAKAN